MILRRLAWLAVWTAVITFPLWIGDRPYVVTLVNQVAIFALWALAFNLVYGYLGEISFGHAAFFGVGAYAVPLAMNHLGVPIGVAMLIGVLAAGVVAAGISVVIRQARGVFYAIMTFTFAQVVYFVVLKWTAFTGGDDGMSVVRPAWLAAPAAYFVFSIVVVSGGAFILHRVVNSPAGHVVRAIAQNERRARQVGYDTGLYRVLTFVISGMLSGLAGSLFSPLIFFVSPNVLHWTFSGEVVIMTIVGGAGVFLGPLLGAAFFVVVQEMVSSLTSSDLRIAGILVSQLGERWLLVMGLLFFLVVVFEPDGLTGLLRRLSNHRPARRRAGRSPAHEIAVESDRTLKGGRR
jgi:branched-chain amino acid transport system permease protein